MLIKVVPVLLLCVLYLGQATASSSSSLWQLSTTDGQPGCRTRYELNFLWRNNWLDNSYWECRTFGQPAVARACPPGTFFQQHWQTCVPESQYIRTPTFDPPSTPWDLTSPCTAPDTLNTETECPCASTTTISATQTTTTTSASPTTTTLAPITTEEVTPPPFVCSEERMGLRWAGDSNNTYWECYILNDDPFLISCPPGFVFNFGIQTCIL